MPSPAVLGKARRKITRRVNRLRWRAGASRRTAPEVRPRGDLPPLVLVVVIDGLRPDSIDANETPNLDRLRREGVSFTNARSVFPTATRVNAASIASGAYPGRTGILHNAVYLPSVDAAAAMTTGRAADLLRAQDALGGRLVMVEGLGEILARHGKTLVAVSSASTGSALLLNPKAPDGVGALVNGEFDPGVRVAYPDEVNRAVLERFGPAPPKAGRSRPRDALVRWTQRVLLEYVLPELGADVVIDWFTEPDHVQHAYGVGSPQARAALRTVDREVGAILDALERLDLRSRTNLFVLSDHGVTRHGEAVDVARALVDAGLKRDAGSDDVVVAGGGPSAQIHVKGRDPERIRRIVRFLQEQPWTGVLFTPGTPPVPGIDGPREVPSEGQGWVEGTFSLELVHLCNPERSGDVLMTLAWTSDANEFGVPGTEITTTTDGARPMHSGHGGLSPWALHTTFLASGPGIRESTVLEAPVAQVDVVPTILALKGITEAAGGEGRVLHEALRGAAQAGAPTAQARTITTRTGDGRYEATLQTSLVDGHRYLHEGRRAS